MSQDADGVVKESDEAVYLLEVGLQPSEYGPPVYTLLLMEEDARNGKDRPLTDEDGYIVWFSEPGDAERALALGDEGFRRYAPPPTEVAASYDFARMFWMVNDEPRETGNSTIEALNLLLDLVEATAFTFPPEYRRTLFALADHLTFSLNIGEHLTDTAARDRAMDAITWCIGAVAIKSRMLPRRDAGT